MARERAVLTPDVLTVDAAFDEAVDLDLLDHRDASGHYMLEDDPHAWRRALGVRSQLVQHALSNAVNDTWKETLVVAADGNKHSFFMRIRGLDRRKLRDIDLKIVARIGRAKQIVAEQLAQAKAALSTTDPKKRPTDVSLMIAEVTADRAELTALVTHAIQYVPADTEHGRAWHALVAAYEKVKGRPEGWRFDTEKAHLRGSGRR